MLDGNDDISISQKKHFEKRKSKMVENDGKITKVQFFLS